METQEEITRVYPKGKVTTFPKRKRVGIVDHSCLFSGFLTCDSL